MYGTFYHNDPYWWNAESQFFMICQEAGLDIYDSVSGLEDSSLYKYDQNNYFDNDGQLINKDQLVFFIMRKLRLFRL
jgi:protein involved in sex pheromone biosynthesis